jgi:hypothetical protein
MNFKKLYDSNTFLNKNPALKAFNSQQICIFGWHIREMYKVVK